MSAAENKQLLQEIFARVAVGDASLFVEHLADDVVMHVSGQYSWSRTTGASKTIPLRFIAEGDLVVIEARGEMTSREGIPYNSSLCERVLGAYPS